MEKCASNGNKDILLNHLEISVSESEKRANSSLNLRDFYTVYLIEAKVTNNEVLPELNKLSIVWRRYTEFEYLRDYFEATYPFIVLPPLPEKRVHFAWQKISTDTSDPAFVDRRRAGLENFLLRVASHPILGWDKQYLQFLTCDETFREPIPHSYLQLVENKLKIFNTTAKPKRHSPAFDSLKEYSVNLQHNLTNLLKARARVVEKQYTIQKLHANYGRVFSEWSAHEKELGDALQKIGHYLDSVASSIDSTLEDEELLADQLKEYLFYAQSLQAVCKKQEEIQQQLEAAEDALNAKNAEREKVVQGKVGIMTRLFGAVETEEIRELRLNVLDQQISEGTNDVSKMKEHLRDFSTKALLDIDQFQKNKMSDLKDTLANYTLLQLKTAKKDLQTWMQIQECLQKL